MSGACGRFKSEKDMDAVIRMDDLLVRKRVISQRCAGASSDGFIRWIHIKSLPGFRVDHPEYLLDVVGHLPEPLLTLQERLP